MFGYSPPCGYITDSVFAEGLQLFKYIDVTCNMDFIIVICIFWDVVVVGLFFTCDIYCRSVCSGRGIPPLGEGPSSHDWEFFPG